MDLRKQVEPLGSCALGFLTPRHAHHAALRFSWVKRWPKRASENHHAQSRELSFRKDLIPLGRGEATSNNEGQKADGRRQKVCAGVRALTYVASAASTSRSNASVR